MAGQMVSLAWGGHHTTLVGVFEKFLEGCKLVDCTIAAEGERLNAHKEVLSAFSPYFENLFREETENNPTVILSGINFRDIKSLVYFMYRGRLEVAENRVEDLLDVADCLKIKGLCGALEKEGLGKANNTSSLRKILKGIRHKRRRKDRGVKTGNVLIEEADANDATNKNVSLPHQNSSDALNTQLNCQSSVQNTMQNFDAKNIPSERNGPLLPQLTLPSIEIDNERLNDASKVTCVGVVEDGFGMEPMRIASSNIDLCERNGNSFERSGESILGLPSDVRVTSDNNRDVLSAAALNLQLSSRDLFPSSVKNVNHFNTTSVFPSVGRTVSAVETQNQFIQSKRLVATQPSTDEEILRLADANLRASNSEFSVTSLQGLVEMLTEPNGRCGSDYSGAASRCAEVEPVPLLQQLPAEPVETEGRGAKKSAVGVLSGLSAEPAEPHAPPPASRLSPTTHRQSDLPGPSGSDSQMPLSSIEKLYRCQNCRCVFTVLSQLYQHQQSSDCRLKQKCTECNYTSAVSSLNEHNPSYTVSNLFKCTECDFSTLVKGSLNVHQRIHSGIKPYKCTECDYATAYACHLRDHERIHSGIRPYKCMECDYAATQLTHLKTHQRIHSGEKPYMCKECDYRCARSESLQKHNRSHHSPITP